MLTLTCLEDRDCPAPVVVPVANLGPPGTSALFGYWIHDDGAGGLATIIETPHWLIVDGVKWSYPDGWTLAIDSVGTEQYHVVGRSR